MINKDSQITKEYIKKVFEVTHNSGYTFGSLNFVKTEDNMSKIINFIDNHDGITITDIEIEIMKLRGLVH